jgi:hypothetical protein
VILGLAAGVLVTPAAGKGVALLCHMEARPRPRDDDPQAPDLAVVFHAGTETVYATSTARNALHHVFGEEFVVPIEAVPPEGLQIQVLDRDRDETVGTMRLDRRQLVDAALPPQHLLTLKDTSGGVQQLELIVTPYAHGPTEARATMSAQEGTKVVEKLRVRAGEVVGVAATGRYQIGSHNNAWLDPRGYPGGGPRSYNFENEPFRSSAHGSALAILGTGDARQGLSVAPCATAVARVGGHVVVGVNDTDPGNNKGTLEFTVTVRPPTATEWLEQRTSPCRAQ